MHITKDSEAKKKIDLNFASLESPWSQIEHQKQLLRRTKLFFTLLQAL